MRMRALLNNNNKIERKYMKAKLTSHIVEGDNDELDFVEKLKKPHYIGLYQPIYWGDQEKPSLELMLGGNPTAFGSGSTLATMTDGEIGPRTYELGVVCLGTVGFTDLRYMGSGTPSYRGLGNNDLDPSGECLVLEHDVLSKALVNQAQIRFPDADQIELNDSFRKGFYQLNIEWKDRPEPVETGITKENWTETHELLRQVIWNLPHVKIDFG